MTDFIRYQPKGIDWADHDKSAARARLSASAHAARSRMLREGVQHFQPSVYLVNAINAAIASRSPLLLTGDPGTGKTQVAWFLAEYFDIPLFDYQVRSESTARDLRYDFDAVAYLRDAYLAAREHQPADSRAEDVAGTPQGSPDPRSHPRYLKPGKLWQAYEHSGECVLLIDEIDKAPRDFPNDLLQELADYRFDHPFEPKRSIERRDQPPPIVVITSNGERRLPDPFLRRCVVHHIELDETLLWRILSAWKSEFEALDDTTQAVALARFLELRKKLGGHTRTPGAAELLIWLTVLAAQGITAQQLEGTQTAELPALACLIKEHEDYAYLAQERASAGT